MKKIAVLRGDGIGPEVTNAALTVLNSVVDLEFIDADIGQIAYNHYESYLPSETLDVISECESILLGTIFDNENDNRYRSPVIDLKRQLDLYANIRTFRQLSPDIGYPGVDTYIVRENSEGMHAVSEVEDLDGVTLNKRVSIKACTRICQTALKVCKRKNRQKITCVHKSNAFHAADGLFKDIFYQECAGTEYQINDMYADKAAATFISNPEELDVVVTLNMYGDILSEEVSALVGGTHITPSGNIGDSMGLFQPMHGAEPEKAGLNVVNPTSAILSSAMMMDHLMLIDAGDKIRKGIRMAYKEGSRTADIGGSMGTQEFADRVAKICGKMN